jgi:membrane protein DedA with SNARE-associated domain
VPGHGGCAPHEIIRTVDRRPVGGGQRFGSGQCIDLYLSMEHFLETWGYLAVFVLSFISAMGLPVGAEVAIIYGGVLASGQVANEPHHLNLAVVILLATLAEVLGSAVGYLIGYFGGRPLVDHLGRYVLLTHKDLDRAERWFARRGEPFVLFGRFIPLLRSFVSFAAGLGEMPVAKFALFTVVGCAIWCTALTSLGYSLGSSYEHVLKAFSYAGYVAAALFVVAVVVLFAHRLRVVRREREQALPRER